MRYLEIPNTDLRVSVLGLGTGGFGTRTKLEDAFAILDRFVEYGGNFLDSAHIYAAWIPNGGAGASERSIGEWIKSRNARSRVLIGTKGGHPHLHSMQISRLSPPEIQQDLNESLERLQVETIDFYWLHRDDPAVPIWEILGTLNNAVSERKIRYFGVSNWSVARMQEAINYAQQHSIMGFVGNQVGWSLAERKADLSGDNSMRFMDAETYRFHCETQQFVAAYSSQANGFFAGRTLLRSYENPENMARLARASELAKSYQTTTNAIALSYLTSQPFPTCALVGCGTLEHLEAS